MVGTTATVTNPNTKTKTLVRILDITKKTKIASIVESLRKNKSYVEAKDVLDIINDVKKNKDKAVRRYERKFTGASPRRLRLTQKEIKSAYSKLSSSEIDSITMAKREVEKTQLKMKKTYSNMLKIKGTNKQTIQKRMVPIESVGCYVPGGKARYPTSAIMSVIPAKIAGVKRVIVTTPSGKDRKADPFTVVAADICGADEIYQIGGPQAIASFAFGTESVQKVDKIVGPGGYYVSAAKFLVSDIVSIDMIAGPTELAIVADQSADAKLVSYDLVSQAEHSEDTLCCVITQSQKLASEISKELDNIIESESTSRQKIIEQSIKKNGFIAVCKNEAQVVELANELAPEHLQIVASNQKQLANKITSAGVILMGKYSPSSASDYVFGSDHILPTNGFGKSRGALSCIDFMRLNTKIVASKETLSKISNHLKLLTSMEGLPNHYQAVHRRLLDK